MHYQLGIIDGNYILRRNFSIQKRSGEVNQSLLTKSFLQSIMKLKRDFDFERPIIVWDKMPYKKLEVLEEYKKDRHYTSQDDIESLEEKLVFAEGEEYDELLKQIESMKMELQNEQTFVKSKYDIIFEGGKVGFPSLIKTGWEGDDLAMRMADTVRELGMTAILISVDRDWVAFRSKEVEYSTPKGDHRYGEVRVVYDYSKELGIPMYEVGILKELYDSSHNNVEPYAYKDEVEFEEFATKIYNEDSSLPGYEREHKFFSAMNMRQYADEVRPMILRSLRPVETRQTEWLNFIGQRHISIPLSKYQEFTEGFQKDYLDGKSV